MTTSGGRYVGIDASKNHLDVAVLGTELIVVEATSGYQRSVVDGLFRSGLAMPVVNPAGVRQFAQMVTTATLYVCRLHCLSLILVYEGFETVQFTLF